MNVLFLSAAALLSFSLTGVSGQLTDEDRMTIVSTHNSFRSMVDPIATNMEIMVWNDELAQLAQSYSENCVFEFNNDRVAQQSTFESVGENLAASTNINGNASRYADLVTSWYNEVADYNYEANSCTAVCGHYTQVVWATSSNVGCGATVCANLQGVSPNNLFFVCNYGPAGNFVGQSPYMTGNETCSTCPDDKPYCDNNLCTANAPPTTSPPTTSFLFTTLSSAGMTTPSTLLIVMTALCALMMKLFM